MIALITVNWNRAGPTLAALRSVVRGNRVPDLLVIVDNGSAAEDLATLRQGLEPFGARAVLLAQPTNLGFSGGNNVGMDHARKQGVTLFWLLNNDTVVTEDALERALEPLADPRVGAVGFALIYDHDRHTVQALGGGVVNLSVGISRHITRRSELTQLNYLTAASVLLRAEAIDQVGGFHPDIFLYWEDVELSLRLSRAGWTLAVVPDAVVYHKESASSAELGPRRQELFSQGLSVLLREHAPGGRARSFAVHIARALRKLLMGKVQEARTIYFVALARR